jgi:hypothetical protein
MFGHDAGTSVTAEYQAGRGSPTLAKWAFFGAVPMAAIGVGFTAWGIAQATRTCDDRLDGRCFPPAGFLLGFGIMNLAVGAAGTWWYLYSQPEKFMTHEVPSRAAAAGIGISPWGVQGTFQ